MKIILALILAAPCLCAQPSLVTVAGTVTNADGSYFTGQITIVAQSMQSGTVSVRSAPIRMCSSANIASCPATIVNGAVSVQLAANDTATPVSTSYYVVYQPTRGTPYSEYWVVPSTGPWTISQVLQQTNPTPGTTINTLLNGTATPPSNGIGNNGDFYLQTGTHCLYGPKASSLWPTPCLSLNGPTGGVGPTGPPVTFRGAWLIGTTYAIGDSVSLGGSSYIATAANTGQTPPNASFWGLLAAGATGSVGPAGPAPAGNGFVSVTGGVLNTPGPLTQANIAAAGTLSNPTSGNAGTATAAATTPAPCPTNTMAHGVDVNFNPICSSVPIAALGTIAGNTVLGNPPGPSAVPSQLGVTGAGNVVEATSPALLGSPTTPTQTALDNSTKIASTGYTDRAIAALCNTCTVGPVCWSGSQLVPCSITALSWAALTSSNWSSLTSGGWAALTH